MSYGSAGISGFFGACQELTKAWMRGGIQSVLSRETAIEALTGGGQGILTDLSTQALTDLTKDTSGDFLMAGLLSWLWTSKPSTEITAASLGKKLFAFGSWFNGIICLGTIGIDVLRCVTGTITLEEMANRSVGNIVQSACGLIGNLLFPFFGGIVGSVVANRLYPKNTENLNDNWMELHKM